MHTYGVILAGGTGTRFGRAMPKQFIELAGRPILHHSVTAFQACRQIDRIIVMVAPGWADHARTMLGDHRDKPIQIFDGGTTRSESTRKALEAIGSDAVHMIVHDAARPLVEQRTIEACIEALKTYSAVGVVVPSADTIVEVDDRGQMRSIPERAWLRRMQTPQAFTSTVLQAAYRHADDDPDFAATDDCGVVMKYLPDEPVGTVPGTERNIKITDPADLAVAESLANS